MANWAWCNGNLTDFSRLPISANDRGTTLGLALFETILVQNQIPQFLTHHIERHRLACQRWGWNAPTKTLIENALQQLLQANTYKSNLLRLRWAQTAGSGNLHEISQNSDSKLILTLSDHTTPPPTLHAIISPWQRNELSPLAGLKSASYAENCLALHHAHQLGAQETIFLNRLEQVCEAATTNVFLLLENSLHTPDLASGCLPGVARAQILHWARQNRILIYERKILRNELFQADAILLTSSLNGIRRLTQLDQHLYQEPQSLLWQKLTAGDWKK